MGPSSLSWQLSRLLRGRLGLCASRLLRLLRALRVLRVLRAWCPAPQAYESTEGYAIEGETHGLGDSHALPGRAGVSGR